MPDSHHQDGVVVQVYCDMTTPTTDGLSGWTLCGKYDRDRAGTRYLQQGFARGLNSAGDMADLSTFTDPSRRWSSIDCRQAIAAGADYMMHAGSDTPQASNPFPDHTQIRFTNIMSDVRENSANLFDTSFDDRGTCRSRNMGGIRTFNSSWEMLPRDGRDDPATNGDPPRLQGLGEGSCMIGDGHHFCTYGREVVLAWA